MPDIFGSAPIITHCPAFGLQSVRLDAERMIIHPTTGLHRNSASEQVVFLWRQVDRGSNLLTPM